MSQRQSAKAALSEALRLGQRCDVCHDVDDLIETLRAAGYAIVPREPTHAMERGYFTAALPAFDGGASRAKRKKNNAAKMRARWIAMVDAAEAQTVVEAGVAA